MMGITRYATGVIAVTAALVAHAPASAQLNHVGFRLGLSRASLTGGFTDLVEDVGGESRSRTGFVAGAYVDYGLPVVHDAFSVQAGLDVVQKGNRMELNGDPFRELDLTYVEVPVLGKATFGNDALRYHALAGPVLSFKQSAEIELDDGERVEPQDITGSDFGFALGAGVRRGRLGLELRYVLGLSNISESDDPDESGKNRQWALTATYQIPIRR